MFLMMFIEQNYEFFVGLSMGPNVLIPIISIFCFTIYEYRLTVSFSYNLQFNSLNKYFVYKNKHS